MKFSGIPVGIKSPGAKYDGECSQNSITGQYPKLAFTKDVRKVDFL